MYFFVKAASLFFCVFGADELDSWEPVPMSAEPRPGLFIAETTAAETSFFDL